MALVLGLSIICQPVRLDAGGLIAHEWGTFTSFQGGDGALMAWQPLATSRLPGFVHTWSKPGSDTKLVNLPSFGGKYSLMALQRLETPVVYFYSDDAETADLTVNFPDGWITEWFPRADRVSRSQTQAGEIRWSNLRALPAAHAGPLGGFPPGAGDHYFAARETDSDYVKTKDETEKFLFYRGAGNFATPLRVTMKTDSFLVLTNTGKETIPHLLIFQVDASEGSFVSVDELKPGEERQVLAPLARKFWLPVGDELSGETGNRMAKALVKAGLYPREAQAMVNTWDDSWFRESGLRVMYILPRPWTDRVLPMALNPAPKELVRVMVGRAEILRPGLEQTLMAQLSEARSGDAAASDRVRQTLRTLGRFAQPALWHVVAADQHLQPDERGRLLSLLGREANFE
jgi:hypothetical protein